MIGRYYYRVQIWLLRVFKPTVLFDRINQLEWYKDTLRKWIDDHQFPPDARVLEAGCASGALTVYMARQGAIPTGIDFSRKMIDLARRKAGNIPFAVADVGHLPFGDSQFDVVIAASLINIVSDKEKAVGELARTCRTGGLISILVPSQGFSDADLASLQASVGRSGFSAAAMEAWHKMAPKMNVPAIVSLFEQAGLADIKTRHYLDGLVIAVSATKPQ